MNVKGSLLVLFSTALLAAPAFAAKGAAGGGGTGGGGTGGVILFFDSGCITIVRDVLITISFNTCKAVAAPASVACHNQIFSKRQPLNDVPGVFCLL